MVTDDGYISTEPQNLDAKQVNIADSNDYDLPCVGAILLDKYKITAKITKGGGGIIFYVIDADTRARYAVKTYKSKLNVSDSEQLVEEATFLINFGSHANIVNTRFVEVINKRPYFFMEYVQGTTLRDRIGQLTVPQAVNLAYQICLGMEFVNKRREIVHADLKPENILVTSNNVAKIIDFGISRVYNLMTGTFPRQSIGTIPYKSPEQLNGGVLRQTSDIFSFGILFFEMLTGKLPYPFSINNWTALDSHKKLTEFFDEFPFYDDPRFSQWSKPTLNEISDDVWEIVIFSMNPNPSNRWQNFTKLRKAFEGRLGTGLVNDQTTNSVLYQDESPDLHKLALSLCKLGKLKEALDVFNQALIKHPDNAEIWRDAALALEKSGNHDFAEVFFARAKEINPDIAMITEDFKGGYD